MERDINHLLDPVRWAADELGFEPDSIQSQVLRSRHRRILLNCSRQWGKSTVTAAKTVHRALMVPGLLAVAMSPSARQTAELLRKMSGFLRKCGVTVKGDGDNEMSFLLPNGSRIVGLPGGEAHIRGFSSVGLLVIDEAARVADASYRAARPMLAVGGGSLLLLSTPFGKRGFFYEAWSGGEDWLRIEAKAEGCGRIPAAFLDEERKSLGEAWFRQEYGCEFIDNETRLFSDELIQRALDKDLETFF
ncbi:MAG: terminase family protein [Bryobacteraceae bacterium]